MLHTGDGVEKNLTLSWRWFKKGADQGYSYCVNALKEDIFKNFELHENTRNSLLCLISIRKFRKNESLLGLLPMDVVMIIAREIWKSRNDESWKDEI